MLHWFGAWMLHGKMRIETDSLSDKSALVHIEADNAVGQPLFQLRLRTLNGGLVRLLEATREIVAIPGARRQQNCHTWQLKIVIWSLPVIQLERRAGSGSAFASCRDYYNHR